MRPDPSRLGANVGFGYLTEDDDDDGGAVSTPDAFDATFASYDATGAVGELVDYMLAISANSAQTNGTVVIQILEPSAGAVSPVTVDLDGWTQTGWSHLGTTWTNTLTRASVASGTDNPTFKLVSTESGTVTVSTATPSPETDDAAGGGATIYITIGGDAAFDAIGSAPSTMSAGSSITWTVDITASGEAQTNGAVDLVVRGSYVTASTLDLDGWSESGWVQVNEATWTNTLTLTNVSVGATAPTFNIAVSDAQVVTMSTADSFYDPPQTTEAIGTGNTVTVTAS